MCLKDDFRCPRPSQICPAILPLIDPPATPAFPSGHALQARLIAQCLEKVIDPGATAPPTVTLLRALGDRIAENRVIAGLHFPRDNEAGIKVADNILIRLGRIPSFNALVLAAQGEF
jgi:hypothetical protein